MRGFERATGDFILCGSADDEYAPAMLATLRAAAAMSPEAGLVCALGVMRHPGGDDIPMLLPFGDTARFVPAEEIAAIIRLQNFVIFTGASLLRRTAIAAAGGLDPRLLWHCDWLLNFVLALRHGVHFVPAHVIVARMEPTAYSRGRFDWSRQGPLLQAIIAALFDRYGDVAPLFRRGALLPSYEIRLLPALLADPKTRPYLSPLLVWRLISYRTLQTVSTFVPRRLAHRLRPFLRV